MSSPSLCPSCTLTSSTVRSRGNIWKGWERVKERGKEKEKKVGYILEIFKLSQN